MIKIRFLQSQLIFEGDLTISEVSDHAKEVLSFLKKSSINELIVDLSGVENIDSSGVAFLDEIKKNGEKRSVNIVLTGEKSSIKRAIEEFSSKKLDQAVRKTKAPFFEILGEKVFSRLNHLKEAVILISDSFYYSITGLVKKKGMRKGEFYNQCMLLGMNSFPIVTIIGFLIGFIIALQSAAQLRQFGAGIYIADLIAISMTREMGPIMTAIVFAGRSGSSIAAEIATMVVTEETDALKSMGLSPVKYVLVPKIYAMTVSVPLLTVYSMVIGILGAMLVGVTYLGLGVEPFYNQVINALILKDVVTGLVKSLVFSWIIVMVAAHFGFRVKGGAEGVGRATTASVVVSIFLVIVADSILGLIFYFGQGIKF